MDWVMLLGTIIFGILFFFILGITALILITLIRKEPTYKAYAPDLTVVIPAYNEAANIEDCIKSVQAARYRGKKDIIVADDGSTDDTVKLAKKLGVRVLKLKHEGKVPALNAGIKATKTNIVVTIDADTVIEKDCLVHLAKPFKDEMVAAVSGPALVKPSKDALNALQRLEYCYNNLVRTAFSTLFHNDVWFFGCLCAYRKDALMKVKYFSAKTMTEDMAVVTDLRLLGYKTIHTNAARGYTVTPSTIGGLLKQRIRWWGGGYQVIRQHKEVFTKKGNGIFKFIFLHHSWWGLYGIVSLPIIIYQVFFWLPSGGPEILSYLFRWFTLLGPIWVLVKIPEGWLNMYNIFGVSAGLLNAVMLYIATRKYYPKYAFRDHLAVFFYFPYTILLNLAVALGLYKAATHPERGFKK